MIIQFCSLVKSCRPLSPLRLRRRERTSHLPHMEFLYLSVWGRHAQTLSLPRTLRTRHAAALVQLIRGKSFPCLPHVGQDFPRGVLAYFFLRDLTAGCGARGGTAGSAFPSSASECQCFHPEGVNRPCRNRLRLSSIYPLREIFSLKNQFFSAQPWARSTRRHVTSSALRGRK